jgi:hypothetical protein
MPDSNELQARSLRTRILGIGQTVRQLGWMNACLYALARAVSLLSRQRVRIHKYYFVAQPVATAPWLPSRRGQSVEIRRVGEFDSLVKQFPRPDWAAPYRFRQGSVCLAALKGGSLAGFLWLTMGPYQEDEVRCRYFPLPAGKSAWDFDVYVEPEQRNGVVFLKLWDEANRFLSTNRFQWSLSRISAFNSGSILSHAKMGTRRIGAATFVTLGPWQIAVATVPPYFHLSTFAGSFPTYALSPE